MLQTSFQVVRPYSIFEVCRNFTEPAPAVFDSEEFNTFLAMEENSTKF